ncbi:hypothetical protein QAD02_011149 [Eretmocerus hayati]|uniref:Uncharacterized protein n=1 Tax=Eretmocerus hayati TaxID=131215 RepID=A0ACC2NWX8_9HYME|nr:hypothetical protein QAD02_011149 [Eretmocerus hayati]
MDASDESSDWEYNPGSESDLDDEEFHHQEDNSRDNSIIDDSDEVSNNEENPDYLRSSDSDFLDYRDRPVYGSPSGSPRSWRYWNSSESEVENDQDYAEDDVSPALSACETNNIKDMRYLINDGFNLNEKINRTTCLHQAITNEHFDMVELLLDSGANLRCLDSCNHGPLHVAIQIRNRKIRWRMVQLLLKSGVSVDDTNDLNQGLSYSTTCIHEAVKVNDFDLILFLLSAGAEINCLSSNSFDFYEEVTPLQQAIISLKGRARYEMVKRLLAAGSDVRLCHHGHTTLHSAVSQKQCSWQLVKLLLDAGAELNVLNGLDFSPLALAAELNHLSLVKNLIHAGADVNISRSYRTSALELALSRGHKNVFEALLRNGADINIMDAEGRNLSYGAVTASLRGTAPYRFYFLSMALSYGAVMVSPEFEKFMPFQVVLQYGDIELIDWFIENGFRLQDCGVRFPLHEAIKNSNESILKYLLRARQFDVDEINDKYCTALLLAITHSKTKHVRLLIEWGADVNISCAKGAQPHLATDFHRRPLVRALTTGQPEVVKLLLAAGASIDLGIEDDDILYTVTELDSLDCFIEYLVLFKSKGFKTKNILKSYLTTSVPTIAKSVNDCKTELNILRTVVLYDRITLYDLLLRKDITRYLSNVQAKTYFESSKLEERFPRYGMHIREFYSLNLLKRELINSSLKGLHKIFGSRFCGDEIHLNITTQLSIKDLRNLCAV